MKDRLVSMQFMVGNTKVIPKGIPSRGLVSPADLEKRKTPTGIGCQIIQNVEKINISEFVHELVSSGYQLVDAFQEERNHAEGGRTYNIVRFTFVLNEHATPSDEFLKIYQAMMSVLEEMAGNSFWKVRAFRNPFFMEGTEVEGEHAISIDLAERVPRFSGDGQLIKVWQKDAENNRIGDSPVPLSPNGAIHFQNDQIMVVAN